MSFSLQALTAKFDNTLSVLDDSAGEGSFYLRELTVAVSFVAGAALFSLSLLVPYGPIGYGVLVLVTVEKMQSAKDQVLPVQRVLKCSDAVVVSIRERSDDINPKLEPEEIRRFFREELNPNRLLFKRWRWLSGSLLGGVPAIFFTGAALTAPSALFANPLHSRSTVYLGAVLLLSAAALKVCR
jgi:hypothetical protein